MNQIGREKVQMMLDLMELETLTEKQLDLVCSFESQFQRSGNLSPRQFEILEDIFKQAAEKA